MNKLINDLENSVAKLNGMNTMIYLLQGLLEDKDIDKAIDLAYVLQDLFKQYNTELYEVTHKLYDANI
jgi:hypothetical protein